MIPDVSMQCSRIELFRSIVGDCEDLIVDENNEGKVRIEWTEPRFVEVLDSKAGPLQKIKEIFEMVHLEEDDFSINSKVKTGFRGPDIIFNIVQIKHSDAVRIFFEKLAELETKKKLDEPDFFALLNSLNSDEPDFS
jgi:hypothetical protein